MAHKRLWNDEWEFIEQKSEESTEQIPQSGWRNIDLPHDWMIYNTNALYRDCNGWYRKEFMVEEQDTKRRICIRFDGVYMDCSIYVNGIKAGEWKYGYSAFEVEITPYIKPGKNEIYVCAVYRSPNSRWYSGAGIYRNVWWISTEKEHIVADGVYITPIRKNDGIWIVETETEVEAQSLQAAGKHGDKSGYEKLEVHQNIFDSKGREISTHVQSLAENIVMGLGCIHQEMTVLNPDLWDVGQGNLYTLRTQLYREGTILESSEQKFGFRTLLFTSQEGLFLNGRHVKLNGVCEHHDFGCLGAAFNRDAMERKLLLLRKMGVNAIRTAHNMPAEEVMELADEMGFLIVSEAFDMWERRKTPYDYARFFTEWYQKDVASWVRRDRNHPSLLMWSIGNEILDTHLDKRGQEVTCMLREAVRESDPKKHAPVTIGSNFMQRENAQACADLIDCAGYNYAEYLYEEQHGKYPDRIIYGSETASILSSRGIYHFPRNKFILTADDEHCSALGNSVTGWGARSCDACICDDRDAAFSLGQFIWTGFDYIGESTPYQTKNSYYGQIDTAGFPKDAFYIYQAAWTDYRTAPMVHVFPYWDFNEGQLIDVQVCSNAPMVELFLNGESVGIHEIDYQKSKKLTGLFTIPYTKGELRAVAYDENYRIIAQKISHSFGNVVRLSAKAEKNNIPADGRSLFFVEINGLDQNEHVVENARSRVKVSVFGEGRLIGLDNGDSTDFEQCKSASRRMFSGKLLAVIASTQVPGDITVSLSSPEIQGCTLTLKTIACEKIAGVSCNENISSYDSKSNEIPVRKIKLSVIGDKVLNQDNMSVIVQAVIYPENASYNELHWKAVNDTGIEVPFVLIEEGDNQTGNMEKTVKVTVKGDGNFRLKCSSSNGGPQVSVFSELEFSADGIGAAVFDPYEEILAGLCDFRTESCKDDTDYSIAFKGEKASYIGFDNVDFGEYGTDEITFPIFKGTDEKVTFQIWEGKPNQKESTMLAACTYHKQPQWIIFQPETYCLSRRIKGVVSIYIETFDQFLLRGFCAKKLEKAFEKLSAAECNRIYGDTYTIHDDAVEEIGNNVILEFENMNFGEEGTNAATLCSRSALSVNPIQLRITGEAGSSVQEIKPLGSSEYGRQTFALQRVKGNNKIELIFLPGSRFDLKWIMFHRSV